MDRWEVWKAYKLADEERRVILDYIFKQILDEQPNKGGGDVVNLQEAARYKTNVV